MSYLPGAEYFWIVADDPSLALSGLFYWVHLFRMTMFFRFAVFLGRMLLGRSGLVGSASEAARRLHDQYFQIEIDLPVA